MDTAWNAFVVGCRDRYGVGSLSHALDAGVSASTFYRRTEREAWAQPRPRVRVAPWVRPSKLTDLSVLLNALGGDALASGLTAAWLYDLVDEPRQLELCLPHGRRAPTDLAGLVRRCRWLAPEDRGAVRNLPVLAPPAMFVTLAEVAAPQLRAVLIDALHRELVALPEIAARLAKVGPVPGRRNLARLVFVLADREVESVFHDLVLDELTDRGYRPSRRPLRIETPDRQGLLADIPLPDWKVAVETHGDRFHSTRAQRAADRRRASQYAGTPWIPLEVDWWEWTTNQAHFLHALDAAILRQVARGIGVGAPLPPHLRGRS